MKRFPADRRGFTLVEILVVVLIIAILAAISIPMYQKSVETSYADDALSTMQTVGTAYRMYVLDNPNTAPSGTLAFNGADQCASPPACDNIGGSPCDLITCNYMASRSFASQHYNIIAGGGCSLSGCQAVSGGAAFGANGAATVACIQRCSSSGVSSCTQTSPYMNWAYAIDANGTIEWCGDAPQPAQ